MIGMMPFFRTRPPTNALENATESIPRLLHCRLHDLNWFHFFRLHFFRLHFIAFIAFSDSPPNFSPWKFMHAALNNWAANPSTKFYHQLRKCRVCKVCWESSYTNQHLCCPKFCSTCAQSFAQLVRLGLHEKVIGNNVDKKPLPRITNIISNGCLP